MRPTFRNLTESFEGWAYRSGFSRELAYLQKRKLLEKRSGLQPWYRLTTQGRLRALGGRDPEAWWSRKWDSRWRLVCFDVPMTENKQRSKLRRFLRSRGFGYLQNSLWITPDPLSKETELLDLATANVDSIILFDARPCGGESSAEIVSAAWDFDRINDLYRHHSRVLEAKPRLLRSGRVNAEVLRSWAESERKSWTNVISIDPLLPKKLLPAGYLGRRVWQYRIKTLEKARRDLSAFTDL